MAATKKQDPKLEPITQQGTIPTPKKQMIADALRDRIKRGVFKPGEQLPPIPTIQEMSGGTAKNTVREALAVLEDQQMIQTVRGLGTYVREEKDWQA